MAAERIHVNARLVTLDPAREGLGVVDNGVVAESGGRIVYAGPADGFAAGDAERFDWVGRLVTPGLVDCHTHLVFGGNRAREFELRLAGATYEEIARAGGGILSTVKATRAASEEELRASALTRLDRLIAEGVTTIEIKSGYGLDVATETKQLRIARELARERPVRVVTTLLAAHALPPEANGDKDAYIDTICSDILPAAAAAGLADAVDGFCETIGFSLGQMTRVFAAARDLGLPVKLHAEQLSNLGGAKLAASFGALSADHLEYCVDEDAAAMAAAGTVAVLLPAPIISSVKNRRRRLPRFGRTRCRWRSPRTAIPAPRRSPRCSSP